MNKVLIKNVYVITMKEEKEILFDVDILIEDDIIIKIEKNIISDDSYIIDGRNKIVLPGFIDAHMHMAMSVFRDTSDSLSLQDWLEKLTWPTEANFTDEDVYYFSNLSAIEMIENGITSGFDHYFMTESTIQACTDIDFVGTRCLLDIDGDGETRFQELKELINKYGKEKINVGIHGLYTCSEEYIKKITDYARENDYTIHMHFCENDEEVETIKKNYNVEHPSMVLEKYFYGLNLVLVHCVVLDDYDINVIKKLNASIVHCPISNLKLGCGIADINRYVNEGINVCLGTDGQGSGNNLSMINLMSTALLLQKGINKNPNTLSTYKMLEMATINAAKAYKKDNLIGTVEVGKNANLILINPTSAQMYPINNIFSDIVYNTTIKDIDTVIVDGKIVMENNKLIKLNKNLTIEKSIKFANELLD